MDATEKVTVQIITADGHVSSFTEKVPFHADGRTSFGFNGSPIIDRTEDTLRRALMDRAERRAKSLTLVYVGHTPGEGGYAALDVNGRTVFGPATMGEVEQFIIDEGVE
jgi:hypothetical protein